jgi:hypothetical protein
MMLVIPSILAAPIDMADCTVGTRKRRVCDAVTGPNGGAGACTFNGNRYGPNYGKCKNTPGFVDDAPQGQLADCTVGTRKRRVCNAVTGPNGLAGACTFNGNRLGPNYGNCKNTPNFGEEPTVEPEPVTTATVTVTGTTTTVTQTSTTTACFQDPKVNQRGRNAFRIATDDDVPLEQCLADCTALSECAGISHRAGNNINSTTILLHRDCAASSVQFTKISAPSCGIDGRETFIVLIVCVAFGSKSNSNSQASPERCVKVRSNTRFSLLFLRYHKLRSNTAAEGARGAARAERKLRFWDVRKRWLFMQVLPPITSVPILAATVLHLTHILLHVLPTCLATICITVLADHVGGQNWL